MKAIVAEGVSKKYSIGLEEKRPKTLVHGLAGLLTSPITNYRRLRNLSRLSEDEGSVFWALKDVSFHVKEGEALGIIGHNGAGKSTLLKILSRITEPSSGEIRIRGRVSSLLEVGTGFHPDLTGRENIYMNGTILGMRKREIDQKLERIIEFSGVSKHIDTPVKRYSSGMKVRLAFSVAAHLEPDILIIDEVLAVGDAEFQRKCLGKMEEVSSGGRTVLFVSHDLTAVQNLCQNAILLRRGVIEKTGSASVVINHYFSSAISNVKLNDRVERRGRGDFRFTDYRLHNFTKRDGENTLFSGDEIGIELHYRIAEDVTDMKTPHVAISISHQKYGLVSSLSNLYSGVDLDLKRPGGCIMCRLDELVLLPGTYYVTLFCSANGERQDVVYNALSFEVLPQDVFGSGRLMDANKQGIFYMRQSWTVR